jgi:protein-S-isoprenylcysteine O-methyltransferase Ste14
MTGDVSIAAIIFDVVLFTLFALHHSLFARDVVRKRVTRMVGALERSTYVWIASGLFIAVCAWWRPLGGVAWRIDQPAIAWVLYAAQLVGVWLTLRSAFMIDVLELAGIAQVQDAGRAGSGAPGEPDRARPAEFKTSGPYGWVRHPIYSGWFLLVFCVPIMTMTRLVFAVTSSVYLLVAIPLEERSLRESTSGAYDRYMRQVRWKLVPHVF